MKKLWGVIAGLVSAFIVVFALEMISHLIYPPPAISDPTDYVAMGELLKLAPLGSLLIVVFGHFLAMFVGTVITLKITKEKSAAYIVIGLFVLLTAMNLYMIKHPMWFVISDMAAVILGGGLPYLAFKNK
ncbi:MAG: hypothetical protein ACI857_003242 [Arenicella sp.]|jgi:hypothetical protein